MTDLSELIMCPSHHRRVFVNRTLNLRSIKAIGYDMDYTLIHYVAQHWELTAYRHLKEKLTSSGWRVDDLEYDPHLMIRGLVIDLKLGNIVKPNRFGYVKRAFHGTLPLDFDTQRRIYSRLVVDIREDRWGLMTTLFDLPVACMYAQLVDRFDRNELPQVKGYADLFELITNNLDTAYAQGLLRQKILKNPEKYVLEDPDVPMTLLDQKHAGKNLVLITDSDWGYARGILAHAFDPHLPGQMTWRSLFDLVVVNAGKPNFFLREQPAFEVVTEDGLLRPVVDCLKQGGIYVGGHAGLIEETLNLDGSEIMYVGDHVEADVQASKSVRRWRTALVLRELEEEFACLHDFREHQGELSRLMDRKAELEQQRAQLRLYAQRTEFGYGPESSVSPETFDQKIEEINGELSLLDRQIGPLAQESQNLYNTNWGLLTRSGYDKSYFTRMLENYADIYMSRVSNFQYQTPFAYLRSTRSSLPHDRGAA